MDQHVFCQLIGGHRFIQLGIHLPDVRQAVDRMPLLRYPSQNGGGILGCIVWDLLRLYLAFQCGLQFRNGAIHLSRDHAEADDDHDDEHGQHDQRIDHLLDRRHDHQTARHPYSKLKMSAAISRTKLFAISPVKEGLLIRIRLEKRGRHVFRQ